MQDFVFVLLLKNVVTCRTKQQQSSVKTLNERWMFGISRLGNKVIHVYKWIWLIVGERNLRETLWKKRGNIENGRFNSITYAHNKCGG